MYIIYLSATYATWGQTNCKLYGYNKFSTTHIPQIHHAFVTDPPTTAPLASDAKMCSTECPYAHGQLFVSPTGEVCLRPSTYLSVNTVV